MMATESKKKAHMTKGKFNCTSATATGTYYSLDPDCNGLFCVLNYDFGLDCMATTGWGSVCS